MFVETEALPARGAVLARRKPRSPGEPTPWVLQVLCVEGEAAASEIEIETSRGNFVGRGRTLSSPRALDASGIRPVVDRRFPLEQLAEAVAARRQIKPREFRKIRPGAAMGRDRGIRDS